METKQTEAARNNARRNALRAIQERRELTESEAMELEGLITGERPNLGSRDFNPGY